jgi:hypothetical protein
VSSSLELFIWHSDPHCFRLIYAEKRFDVFEGAVDTATHTELLEGQL